MKTRLVFLSAGFAPPGNVATLSGANINAGNFYTLVYSGNSNQSVGFKLTLISNQ